MAPSIPLRRLVTNLAALIIPSLSTPAPAAEGETIIVVAERDDEAPTNHGLETALEDLALTPGGAALVRGEDLRERKASNLAEALRDVPGVWAASASGSLSTFLSIRGSNLDSTDWDGNGVKLLQDGLPVTAADGSNHNRLIDPLSARYITVARGANAVEYGASTLGGAIDMVTPTAYDSPTLSAFLSGGSHGHLLGRASASRVFDHGLDGLITAEGRSWDGYRDHNEQERIAVYANAGWEGARGLATRLYAGSLSSDEELPGALSRAQIAEDPDQASTAAVAGDFAKNVNAWRIASKTTWSIAEDRRLDLGFSYEEQDLFHPILAADQFFPGFPGLVVVNDHHDLGAVLRYRQRLGEHELIVGVNAGHSTIDGSEHANDGGARGALLARIEHEASTVELYALDRWRIGERWTLILAAQAVTARREIRETDPGGTTLRAPDDRYGAFNPRVGAIYHLGEEAQLFANVSRLFEPPTLFQLEDQAGGGDTTLDAMRGISVEIGSRGRRTIGERGAWRWDLALYHAWLRDEILAVEDPSAPGTSITGNVDRTIHAGLEASLGAELAVDDQARHGVEATLAFSLNHFRFDGHELYDDNRLPAAHDAVLRGELLYRHAGGWYGGPTVEFVGERYADFANSFVVDSYALLGLRAGWSDERRRVFVELRNLLDEDFIAAHGIRAEAADNDAILHPGEPLSVYAGAEFNW